MKGEARGCKDVACLTEASAALCHLAGLHADVSKQALQALLVLLCNRFPKVMLHAPWLEQKSTACNVRHS